MKGKYQNFTDSSSFTYHVRPYFNHSVEFKKNYSSEERFLQLEKAGFNVFYFPSEMVTGCDFLSDSGTTTMTNLQWSSLHLGDEAYGSNRGYFLLMEKIGEIFGSDFSNDQSVRKPNAFIFHQGRSCENALFTQLGKLGNNLIIPSNGHFDTTEANIQENRIDAFNLFSKELKNHGSDFSFKGNMDTKRLEKLLSEKADLVPVIFITVTNNTGGGQPVSMDNIRKVSRISKKYSIPLFLDACRFAENAYFIKKYEKGYSDTGLKEIIREMFSYADGFTISFKKDGLVNMGGGLFLKRGGLFLEKYPALPDRIMDGQITKEGHPTYGGMSGRDIMSLVYGLDTVISEEYLEFRINQVRDFGMMMKNFGLPVITPIGGHAVYLDMNEFFKNTSFKPSDYGGISFTAILLGLYGHRGCELGNFAFGKFDKSSGREVFPEVNFVRFAVPRLRYEREDLYNAAESVKSVFDRRENLPKARIVYGKELTLRHFKARFKLE